MVFKFFKDIKNYSKGITLIELLVVIFIIATFSLMAISDFPRILRESALSKITHKLSQDIRSVQDMSLSGVLIKDKDDCAVPTKGYGVYFTRNNLGQYLIYADVNGDKKYFDDFSYRECSNMQYYKYGTNCGERMLTENSDCVIKIVSITEDNSSLSIKHITNSNSLDFTDASINFNPPNPTTTLTYGNGYYETSDIIIIFQNTDGSERSVIVNSSGLIDVP